MSLKSKLNLAAIKMLPRCYQSFCNQKTGTERGRVECIILNQLQNYQALDNMNDKQINSVDSQILDVINYKLSQ
ncbi:MAG: hypothetical protein WC389_20115 [Lutibacter sp.]|jgi:hypothetical protein